MANKLKTHNSSKRFSLAWLGLAIVLVAIAIFEAGSPNKVLASSASLSITPTSGTYKVGDSITVSVYENSGSDGAIAVQADFTYPQDVLQYTGMDTSGSGFSVAAPSSGGSGLVTIDRGSTMPVTNNVLVATVTFQVLAAGTANLSFSSVCQSSSSNSCVAVYDTTATTNIASIVTGASFTLQSQPTTTPPTTTPPTTTPPTTTPPTTSTPPSPPSYTNPGTTNSGGSPGTTTKSQSSSSSSIFNSQTNSNSYTPQGSTTPVTVPNNAPISTSVPISIQPSTVQQQGVKRVDYYLNKKLVYSTTNAPYAYTLNTKKLLDGKYNLVSNTVYTTGRVSTSSQEVYVTNPLSVTQILLFIKHYLTVPLIVIVAVLIVWKIMSTLKKRLFWMNGGGNGLGGGGRRDDPDRNAHVPYAKQPEAPVIRPHTAIQVEAVDESSESE